MLNHSDMVHVCNRETDKRTAIQIQIQLDLKHDSVMHYYW